MKEALLEVELIPAQGDQFGDPQPMAIGQEDRCVVAVPMASEATSRFAQLLDLGWREMLTGARTSRCLWRLGKVSFGTRISSPLNFPVYDSWTLQTERAQRQQRRRGV